MVTWHCSHLLLNAVLLCAVLLRRPPLSTIHGTGSLGHRVSGSFGSSFTSGSPGYHFDLVWAPSFPVFEKKCKTYIWNAEMTKVIVRCLLLDWNHWMPVRAMNFYFYLWLLKNSLAWEYFFTHKSTFGVHYRTGSPGQLGLRVAAFPGHWVAGSQNVTDIACRPGPQQQPAARCFSGR